MQLAFWEWMIRGGESAPDDESSVLGQLGLKMREGKLKSGYGPYRARDLFKVPLDREDGPIWTFDRMGATRTELPNGRVVCIGGEHEDYYDPDFCIYNDVVVLGPADEIEIYGYPKEVFPPTDFHTANLVGDRIIIIGCLGYPDDRHPGHTPVYALDLPGYRISEVETSGEKPGWVFKHEAECDPQGVITLRGGEVIEERDGKQRYRRNLEEYALDIRSRIWHRLTNRNWRQFSIRQADRGLFVLEQHPEREALLPRSIEHDVEPCDDWNRIRFVVQGVPVSVVIEVSEIEMTIEGALPDEIAGRIAEEVRASAEAAIQRQCILERV
jgi:hypothetical protein